jgi:hypothetical protein
MSIASEKQLGEFRNGDGDQGAHHPLGECHTSIIYLESWRIIFDFIALKSPRLVSWRTLGLFVRRV